MTTESPSQKPPYHLAIVGTRRSPVGFEHHTNSQAEVQHNCDTPGRAVKLVRNRTGDFGVRQFPNLRRISGTFPSWIALTALLLLACSPVQATQANSDRPNIVLVMIDDMGYGDLSCHGSPFIATPHLDQLHSSSIRLTNFHVAPMCSPTRGQLLTGLDAMRNGSTIVAGSRMMVRQDVPMLPAHLAAAGYATAIFGKWHLGENYPHRPQDRGFQQVLTFGLQEIGSLADHWCNDYFDPVLRTHEGPPRQFSGYCTDIFFDQALQWMRQQHAAGRAFFCYLPLNVVHGPQWAPAELRQPIGDRFPRLSPGQIGYLAMLANVDQNMGRLESCLEELGQRDNTIVIFLSDNGGYALIGHYNAGMRDGKSRLAEGGHRVPCFIRWPGGGLGGSGHTGELTGLTQVQDLLPTLLELCAVPPIAGASFDGLSLAEALRRRGRVPDRTLIVQYGPPEPFRMSCVMEGPWRLLSDIRGRAMGAPELYNLDQDPLQLNNLYDSQPEQAQRLRAAYDRWWSEVEPYTRQPAYTVVGHPAQQQVTLSSAEWRDGGMASVARLRAGDVKRRGVWDVQFERHGVYEFALRRWPVESALRLGDAAPPWTPVDSAIPDHGGYQAGVALAIESARLRVGDQVQRLPITRDQPDAAVRLDVPAGPTELEAFFQDAAGKLLCPAFYVSIRRVE